MPVPTGTIAGGPVEADRERRLAPVVDARFQKMSLSTITLVLPRGTSPS